MTNAAVFIVGIINKLIGNGANYWFICEKPSGDSPFLIGEWPYYLFTFQLAGFIELKYKKDFMTVSILSILLTPISILFILQSEKNDE